MKNGEDHYDYLLRVYPTIAKWFCVLWILGVIVLLTTGCASATKPWQPTHWKQLDTQGA